MRHSLEQRVVFGRFLIRPWLFDRKPGGQRSSPQPRVNVAQQAVHEVLRAAPRVGAVDEPRLARWRLLIATGSVKGA